MKLLLLLYCCCLTAALQAQEYSSWATVDSKALRIPRAETWSTAGIATYIQNNFSSSQDKIRAIYKWITSNISYSKDSMYFSNWGGDPEVKLAATLRKRKGVCENYAALFTSIAQKCGIQSVVVSGYTKSGGSVNWAGHSWCAVKLDGEWYLCDPTWDAGFTTEASWFLNLPQNFLESHMPFDPMWQLVAYPITHKEFSRGFAYSKKQDTAVHVTAVVDAYLLLDTLQQLETATRRIKEAGFDNEQLKTWHAYNQMKVTIVRQEEDMNLYNLATEDLNRAKKQYNEFVKYRNSGFFPARPAREVFEIFDLIEASIAKSKKIISKIGKVVENYQYDTGELLVNLNKLAAKAREQKEYYLANVAVNKVPVKRLQ